MATSSCTAHSPLEAWHASYGARFVEQDGWKLPVAYSTSDRESEAINNAVGVCDLSAYAKLSLRGPAVAALAEQLHVPQPRQAAWFDADGPCLACRLVDDHLLLLATATDLSKLEQRVTPAKITQPLVEHEATSWYAGICLAGPKTHAVLQPLTSLNVSCDALPPGACAETNVAGIHALLVRPPQTAVDAVWIYVAWDLGWYLADRLMAAGRSANIQPVGLEAWRKLASGTCGRTAG